MVLLVSCEGNLKKSSVSHSNNDSITKYTSSSPTLSVRKDSFIEQTDVNKTQDNIIFSNIDSVSLSEIKQYVKTKKTIYDYYHFDDESVWSEKMFGRCCSNTDLRFTENLFLKVNSNISNKKYPINHASDTEYLTSFAFKPSDQVRITLYLDKDNSFIEGKYSNKNILKDDEIIMHPIKLSIINGYVKSEDTFYENGRVKTMDVYVNNQYKQTVVLIDTPLIQEFKINSIFKTNDTISLVPTTYYKGTKYEDICISEIQTNLGQTALKSLNEKYNLMELINKQ